jgi:endo-1,4-beta-D-glucanase Y
MAVDFIFGQAHPFPQNVNYSYGFKPTTVTSNLAQNEYNRMKSSLIVSCNGNLRPITDVAADTKVEAMGFSMLMAAYEGDKIYFDGLYNFYLSKRTATANNMMSWWCTCDGFHDQGSATDGDIDVAFSLIVAYSQWGGDYLNAAKNILQIVRNSLIVQCSVNGNNVYALAGGYSTNAGGTWGGCGQTDIMYYTPAYFRVFASVTGDATWNQLADDTYTILNASANSTTGLVPDWQTAAGTPGPNGQNGTYAYDACRVPWRIALDYLWNGNTNALAWCTKVSNWANGIGPANIKDGYNLDGSATGTNNNSAFVGGFSCAAMCNSQAIADNFGTRMSQLNDSYWFNLFTRVIYLHVMTGNFWKPDIATGTGTIKEKDNLYLFPNPVLSDDKLSIIGLKNVRSVEIVTMSGQVIESFHNVVSEGLIVDVSTLSKGVYIAKINTNDGNQQNFKFIK